MYELIVAQKFPLARSIAKYIFITFLALNNEAVSPFLEANHALSASVNTQVN